MSTSSSATLLVAMLSLGSYVFCLLAFLPLPPLPASLPAAPAAAAPAPTRTGSTATPPMSSSTVLHTRARLFLASSGSTPVPSCSTTSAYAPLRTGRMGSRAGYALSVALSAPRRAVACGAR